MPPSLLLNALKQGNCGLFVGSGISKKAPTKLSNWSELLNSLISVAEGKGALPEIIDGLKKYVDNKIILEVAEYLQGNYNNDYRDYLYALFNP